MTNTGIQYTPAPPGGETEESSGYGPLIIASIGLAAFACMETMILPIIPTLQTRYSVSGPAITWVLTGMSVFGAVALPLVGRLAELFDKRNVMLGVLAAAALGAFLAAAAPNFVVLTLGQMLQGIGIAMAPVAIAIVRDTMPASRLHIGTGIVVAIPSITAAVGLFVVGPIIRYLNYSFIYWIPAAFLVLSFVLTLFRVPKILPQAKGRADWIGSFLLVVGLLGLLLGLTFSSSHSWVSIAVLAPIVLGLAATALFLVYELRTESPILDVRQLGQRDLLIAVTLSFLAGVVTYVMYLVIPSLAVLSKSSGYGMGVDAGTAGLVMIPFVLVSSVSAIAVRSLNRVMSGRSVMVLASFLLIAAGLLLLLVGQAPWILYVSAGVSGAGMGMGAVQQINIVVGVVPEERVATASSAVYVLRYVGCILGGQVAAAILAANLSKSIVPGKTVSTWGGYQGAILVFVGAGVISIVLSFLVRSKAIALPAGAADQIVH